MIDYRLTINDSLIIKCFAICAMLVHHLFWQHPEYGVITYQISLTGKICVALFVFLSGYGLTIQYSKIKESDIIRKIIKTSLFLAKRLTKFYIGYWIIFLITVPLGVFAFGRSLDIPYGPKSNHFVCLIVGFDSYNTTWWFNALILTLWLIFPILYWSMHRLTIALPMLVLFLWNPDDVLFPLTFVADGLPLYIKFFAEGIFIAIYMDRINLILNKVHPYVVGITSTILSFFLLINRNMPWLEQLRKTTIDFYAVIFIFISVVSLHKLAGKYMNAFIFVGKHSMNMYLLHTFILGCFFHNIIYGMKYPIIMFVVLFGTSLCLSIGLEFLKKKMHLYLLQEKILKILSSV